MMLVDTEHDIFWVLHDPAQALFRPDVVGQLGLDRLELFEDHRNPPSVARLAARFRDDAEAIEVLREEGLPAAVLDRPAQVRLDGEKILVEPLQA